MVDDALASCATAPAPNSPSECRHRHAAPHHQIGTCQRRSAPDHARFLQLSETPPPPARCHSEGFPTGRVSVCKTPVSTTLGLGCGRPVTAHAAA